MAVLYQNLAGGATTDDPLTSGATTINSTALQYLPEVVDPDYMWLTLDPAAVNGLPEIVKVTAHTAAATSVTVTRAQQSTIAREHPSGTVWVNAITTDDIASFLDHTDPATPYAGPETSVTGPNVYQNGTLITSAGTGGGRWVSIGGLVTYWFQTVLTAGSTGDITIELPAAAPDPAYRFGISGSAAIRVGSGGSYVPVVIQGTSGFAAPERLIVRGYTTAMTSTSLIAGSITYFVDPA